MFKVVGNPEIEKLLNDNVELVANEVHSYFKDAVNEDCWFGGLDSYIPYFFECMSIEIEDEYIEFDYFDVEVDVNGLYEVIRNAC